MTPAGVVWVMGSDTSRVTHADLTLDNTSVAGREASPGPRSADDAVLIVRATNKLRQRLSSATAHDGEPSTHHTAGRVVRDPSAVGAPDS
jgi:hypothetical protein